MGAILAGACRVHAEATELEAGESRQEWAMKRESLACLAGVGLMLAPSASAGGLVRHDSASADFGAKVGPSPTARRASITSSRGTAGSP